MLLFGVCCVDLLTDDFCCCSCLLSLPLWWTRVVFKGKTDSDPIVIPTKTGMIHDLPA